MDVIWLLFVIGHLYLIGVVLGGGLKNKHCKETHVLKEFGNHIFKKEKKKKNFGLCRRPE